MVRSLWLMLVALLTVANGCTRSEGKVTQVIVVVDAAEDVRARLTRVEIATHDPENADGAGELEVVDRAPFEINDSDSPGTASFPFSVSVHKKRGGRFLLAVTGYGLDESGSAVAVIEQKAIVSFVDGQTRGLGIYLAAPCLDNLCDGQPGRAARSCYVKDGKGECREVARIETLPVRPDDELDAGLIDAGPDGDMDANPDPDPGQPSDYALGVAGQPCAAAANQRLACEGHASRTPLKCDGKIWQAEPTCPEDARCDSRIGRDQGRCVTMPPACLGESEGDVCDGTDRRRCGPDLVTLSDHPCAENMHCEREGGAHCECNPGFDDDGQGGCEDHPDCPAGACSGGTCVDAENDWSCDCAQGFAGTGSKECKPVRYCPKDACTPGGSCVDAPSWFCMCPSGYAGTGTQACRNIDDCAATSCRLPNGTCRDGVATYTCECAQGYSGPDCQLAVCDPNPCQHGAPCTSALNDFKCDCGASGYTGKRCELDANECASTNLCSSADYPCAQTAPPGYLCVGQYAEWRMPDALPGSKFSPSYDTSMAGVVIDRVTGLIWQRNLPATYAGCTVRSAPTAPLGDTCTWAEARSYCDALEVAGHSDWRLPSKIELESITDETTGSGFDTSAFPATPTGYFWTTSTIPARTSSWVVEFGVPNTTAHERSMPNRVRCVRGYSTRSGTPATRFVIDTAADTVTDTRTELIWRRSLSSPTTWQAAFIQCQSPWRVPALKELLTLVDPVRINVSSDPAFPNTPAEEIWTASPLPGSDVSYYVHGTAGYSGLDFQTNQHRTRCVR